MKLVGDLQICLRNAHAEFEDDQIKIAVSIIFRLEPSKLQVNHAQNEQNLRN